jgi:hypothetical protein
MGWYGLDWSGSGEGHGNEPSSSIKCWEVLELLHNWRLLKKDSAPWSYLSLLFKLVLCTQEFHIHNSWCHMYVCFGDSSVHALNVKLTLCKHVLLRFSSLCWHLRFNGRVKLFLICKQWRQIDLPLSIQRTFPWQINIHGIQFVSHCASE